MSTSSKDSICLSEVEVADDVRLTIESGPARRWVIMKGDGWHSKLELFDTQEKKRMNVQVKLSSEELYDMSKLGIVRWNP